MNKENPSNDSIDDLIFHFLSGNASSSEIQEIYNWIALSGDNRNKFQHIKAMWAVSGQTGENLKFNTPIALDSLHRKMNSPKSRFISLLNFYAGRAAILLLVFLLGSLGTYFLMKNKTEDKKSGIVSVSAPKGSKAVTILPDGTQVWLNAGSNLSYDVSEYNNKVRDVTLTGEGFFKVKSDAQKPFIVSAKNLKVKALGTEFNVKAYPEENIVETTLVKGLVKVEGKDQSKKSFTITMNPKQKVTVYAGETSENPAVSSSASKPDADIHVSKTPSSLPENPVIDKEVRTDLYTSWKDDRWIIEGEEIGSLAVILERKYNIQIDFNCEELKHYKFTGTFQNETLEQVLKILKLTAPLKYSIGKGRVNLVLDPELKIKYKKYMNY